MQLRALWRSRGPGGNYLRPSTPRSKLIVTLLITILVEGAVVLAYCIWRKKPLASIFVSSVVANILTQSMLWVLLWVFFQSYFVMLLICEVLIWLLETFLLYIPRKNQLTLYNAMLLSLSMNVLSFGVGWFLPV
jgi:hypothetical protein